MSSMSAGCRLITYDVIKKATNYFDDSNVIGKGGEGKVYKGELPDGQNMIHVAVKCLKFNSNEFRKEINLLSNLHHANLVSLKGYCQQHESKILVYELMVNGSLHESIYKRGGCSLSWDQRLNICIGAARGLEYLHTGTSTKFKIIHRDVKPANILLDENFDPKISDFGLSRRGPANQTRSAVSTKVKGTVGYYAPECFTTGQITIKVDVYAFGVVLFEVLCRKKPWERLRDDSNVEDQSIGQWASENIDIFLDGAISTSCFHVFIAIAEKCLNKDPFLRPTMNEVVSKLEHAFKLQKSDFEAGKSAMMLRNPYRKISESTGATGSNKPTNFDKISEKNKHGFESSKGTKHGVESSKGTKHGDLRRTESGKATKTSRERASGSSLPTKLEGTGQHSIGSNESSKSGNTSSRMKTYKSLPSQDSKIQKKIASSGETAKWTYTSSTNNKAGLSMTPRSTLLDIPDTERKIVLYSTVQTYTDCHKIRLYLNTYNVAIEERDPTKDERYEAELRRFFSRTQRQYCLPQLFIGRKYVGGADEVDRLFCTGELGELLSELNQV